MNHVIAHDPDLFIYLGDNIYGDTRKMGILKKKYKKLANKSTFKRLVENTEVLAIWDDHDYGENDAGRHYPFKAASREIFLDFWKEPDTSLRREHKGIYHSLIYGPLGKQVQIILLDTRTFRDDLVLNKNEPEFKNDYKPNPSPDSTLLGKNQWDWLEKTLLIPAEIRIIASSIQFSHDYNGYESWTNVPHERTRMVNLIEKTGANGVIFISGDVHWGEISKLNLDNLYPIYDITSSGLTQTWDAPESNTNRIGEVVMENNFGLIEIHWADDPKFVTMQIFDINNVRRLEHKIEISNLKY
jgi:alkaline phosphatase D